MSPDLKIVFFASFGEAEIAAALRQRPGVTLHIVRKAAELAEALPGADILMLSDPAYGKTAAEAVHRCGTKLRWVHSFTAGYNNLQAHGIPPGVLFTNGGDAWSPAVAEHGMAMLLALTRQLPHLLIRQTEKSWDRDTMHRIRTLDGQRMVIIGFGSIGREVAKRARPFGMQIIGITRAGAPHELADEMHGITNLPNLLPTADAIVLALPYSPATHHLIDAKALDSCRRHAIIINLARGGVIDQAALATALHAGGIGGAGLDVTDPEPLPPDDKLWHCPNLIISPHIAGTSGNFRRQAETAAANLDRFLAGQALAHQVRLDLV
jgi:phosphoglycerate dehydrogenase-like enzyme